MISHPIITSWVMDSHSALVELNEGIDVHGRRFVGDQKEVNFNTDIEKSIVVHTAGGGSQILCEASYR